MINIIQEISAECIEIVRGGNSFMDNPNRLTDQLDHSNRIIRGWIDEALSNGDYAEAEYLSSLIV